MMKFVEGVTHYKQDGFNQFFPIAIQEKNIILNEKNEAYVGVYNLNKGEYIYEPVEELLISLPQRHNQIISKNFEGEIKFSFEFQEGAILVGQDSEGVEKWAKLPFKVYLFGGDFNRYLNLTEYLLPDIKNIYCSSIKKIADEYLFELHQNGLNKKIFIPTKKFFAFEILEKYTVDEVWEYLLDFHIVELPNFLTRNSAEQKIKNWLLYGSNCFVSGKSDAKLKESVLMRLLDCFHSYNTPFSNRLLFESLKKSDCNLIENKIKIL